MSKKLLINNCSNNRLMPVQDGLVSWLDVDSYHGLIWQDKTSNKKIFKTPAVKNIVNGMIKFECRPTDYFLCEDMNLDWNNTTIQIQIKEMEQYGDSSIVSINGFNGFQISTTNALGQNKLRLNKNGGRCIMIKDLDLSTLNNVITCVFSDNLIGLSVDDGEMQKQSCELYPSSNLNKICIGANAVNLSGSSIIGKFGSILIYNRVLTMEEIKHNCLYIKSKTGGI